MENKTNTGIHSMRNLFKNASKLGAALVLGVALTTTPQTAHAGTEPFIGEIQPTGVSGFCPRQYLPAAGQILAITQFSALFALVGTRFGGDGRTTFALPDLRSRVPVHYGNGPGLSPVVWAQKRGAETVSLISTGLLPTHSHRVRASNADGDKAGPGGKLLAAAPNNGTGTETIYSDLGPNRTMSPEMIDFTGSGIPFAILDPTQVIRYCIAIEGTFPSRP